MESTTGCINVGFVSVASSHIQMNQTTRWSN
jgi:hypothetical protein